MSDRKFTILCLKQIIQIYIPIIICKDNPSLTFNQWNFIL